MNPGKRNRFLDFCRTLWRRKWLIAVPLALSAVASVLVAPEYRLRFPDTSLAFTYTVGLLSGLALGLALVGLVGFRATSLKSENDVVAALGLPVLAAVPAMLTWAERRRRRRRRLAFSLTAATALVASVAAVAWVIFGPLG